MKLLHLWILLSLCIINVSSAQAHAIRHEIGVGGITVKALFDDHQPAKGLFVSVFRPGSFEKFQTGKTDLNGCFAFCPDITGNWEMLIYDQMGHRLEIIIPFDESMKTEGKSEKVMDNSLLKMVAGIIVILIIFGILGWIKK